MLNFLPAAVRGSLALLAIVVNTVFWACLLFPVAGMRVVPVKPWRKLCERMLNGIATNWISVNNASYNLFNRVRFDVTGLEGLSTDSWLLVLSNHQSWSDILVLQRIFNRRIPFLKFFIKKELIYVPILGQAWWALDYPIMQRHTAEQIARDPSLKDRDLETTRRACEKFRTIPVSIMNFVEGTRFTPAKHDQQQSPYASLLKPKAAGIAFVLAAMGDQLTSILDVTIVYAKERRDLWDYLCGRISEVKVQVKALPVTEDLIGDYDDPEFRSRFQGWINRLWADKDARIAQMLAG